ncbi:MAG: hypothetical protein ACREMF_03135 [Gemmatimonadales bacterium]
MRRGAVPFVVASLCTIVMPARVGGQEVTAIRAGRLVDVERGEVRQQQVILIRGERASRRCRPPRSRYPATSA